MQSRNFKPYIYAALAVVMVVGGMGYYLMLQKSIPETSITSIENNRTSTSSVSDTIESQVSQVLTYTNPVYGYSLKYNSSDSLSEIGAAPNKFACVLLEMEGGYIYINSSRAVSCYGLDIEQPKTSVSEKINIADQQYDAYGFLNSQNMAGQLGFSLNRYTHITFGVKKNSVPDKWVYDQLMIALKNVLATIQFNSKTNSTPPQSTLSDNGAEVLYHNPDFGISFTYPKDWNLKYIADGLIVINSPDFKISNLADVHQSNVDEGVQILIYKPEYTDYSSLDPIITEDEFLTAIIPDILNKKIVVPGASDAIEYSIRLEGTTHLIEFIMSNRFVTIQYNAPDIDKKDANYKEFKNIVNSIKVEEGALMLR